MTITQLLLPDLLESLESGDLDSVKEYFGVFHASDIADLSHRVPPETAARLIKVLRAPKGIEVFEHLPLDRQEEVLGHLGRDETVKILEEMSSDDRVDLLKHLPDQTVENLLPLIAQAERDDIRRLLAFAEGTAGSIMATAYAALPVDATVGETLAQLRKVAPDRETIYYVYLLDNDRRLAGVVSLRQLVLARPEQKAVDVGSRQVITLNARDDQEGVARQFKKYDFLAMPVVDDERRLVGIVTHDDVLDVLSEEHTEDVHKMGAVSPLETSYLNSGFLAMFWSRGIWLLVLFIGEMFTATAMSYYEDEIARAVVLALFVPLIISSGGNTGSQATSLIIRALALGELTLRDWWRVFLRELRSGLALGALLGGVGLARVVLWPPGAGLTGRPLFLLGATVAFSLVGVVLFGTLAGSMLPFLLRRLGLDPATASAPFVATLVDVTGLVIYFTMASLLLHGMIL